MQPGERLTLRYHSFSRRGHEAAGGPGGPESGGDTAPLIKRLPFHLDRRDSYNEWIADHLPE